MSLVPKQYDIDDLIRKWNPAQEDLSVSVDGVNHYYGEGNARKAVLHDNDLKIRAGEVVILTGPSGSGKTTLLTLIGTLRRVQEGSLKVGSSELNGMPQSELVELRKEIGFIFQAHNLFESLTAFENVRMATDLVNRPARTSKVEIEAILTRLGLGDRIHYKPGSLSGGQKQRVAVARGLIHGPKLILADEPTAALDAESSREVVTMLQELARDQGTTIIIVTHDNRILDVADRMLKLVDGRIVSNMLTKHTEVLCGILRNAEEQTSSNLKLFSRLTPSVLTDVADKMDLRQYSAGEDVVRQGDIGHTFFVIARGDVDVIANGTKVSELHSGEFFGEVALLDEVPRTATIRARNDVVCFALDKQEFQEVRNMSASFEEEIRKAIFDRR